MRNSTLLAAAVAATLGGGSAYALNPAATLIAPTKLTVSGASAQRDIFLSEIQKMCQAGTFNEYRADDPTLAGGPVAVASGTLPDPDFRAYSCTTLTAAQDTLGYVSTALENTNVVVYYRSEGGSVYGVGPVNAANTRFAAGVKKLTVSTVSTTAGCNLATATNTTTASTTAYWCFVTGYNLTTDAAGAGSLLDDETTDLGVSDVEPDMFYGENWPVIGTSALGGPLTKNQLATMPREAATGTVFGILLDAGGSVTAGISNLSAQSIASIFSGATADWSQVVNPATGAAFGAGEIRVCRREPGSGTQVAIAASFLDSNCGGSSPFAIAPAATFGNPVEELSTSTGMGVCAAKDNAIGFASFGSAPSGTKFIAVDGIAPDKVSAARGVYTLNYEATFNKRPGLANSGTNLKSTLASDLIKLAQKSTALATSATSAAFALPAFNTPVLPVSTTQPVAIGTRNGASCQPQINQL